MHEKTIWLEGNRYVSVLEKSLIVILYAIFFRLNAGTEPKTTPSQKQQSIIKNRKRIVAGIEAKLARSTNQQKTRLEIIMALASNMG